MKCANNPRMVILKESEQPRGNCRNFPLINCDNRRRAAAVCPNVASGGSFAASRIRNKRSLEPATIVCKGSFYSTPARALRTIRATCDME